MGKTARWFRGLLGGGGGGKKAVADAGWREPPPAAKDKKKWSFVRSFKDRDRTTPPPSLDPTTGASSDPEKHAIAVAAATAAVAEAAVAAAQAAAAVVRLTSSGRCSAAYVGEDKRHDWAAVKIQSAFRGYLARRALRALKALVKLQALVRGHIIRKQTAEMLRCIRVLVRAQARARAVRAHGLDNGLPSKVSPVHQGPATPQKHEHGHHTSRVEQCRPADLKRSISKPNGTGNVNLDRTHLGWNRSDCWMDEQSRDDQRPFHKGRSGNDDRGDRILVVDSGKPNVSSRGRSDSLQSSSSNLNSRGFPILPDSPSKDSTTAQFSIPSPSVEIQSLSPLRFPVEIDELPFCTADNSPQFLSASSGPGSVKRGPFTPAKSDCSRGFLSGCADYPNYMAYTESSRAKVRSQSAPKQRPEFEKSSSTKRFSVHGFGGGRGGPGIAPSAQRSLHAKFTSKAYPGSGRLDRLGMPVCEVMGSNATNCYRF